MKTIMTAGAALLMTTTIAAAAGLDRSGQPIGIIFEEGDYAELSFGLLMPNVSSATVGGNVAQNFTTIGLGYKQQLNDAVSVALIMDQPFGADIAYPLPGGAPAGTIESYALTALARYELDNGVSFHGGARYVTASGYLNVGTPITYSTGSDVGYVLGAAYERPEIALRVALTYSSAVTLSLASDLGTTLTADLPETVNLDFQTGVAEDTLVFGSIRWGNWDESTLTDNSPIGTFFAPSEDGRTYSIGIGRRFSDELSGAFTIGYEAAQGGIASALSPTDGNISFGVGATYSFDNGMELTGGVRYINVGDAVAGVPGIGAVPFEGNEAYGVGFKIAYQY